MLAQPGSWPRLTGCPGHGSSLCVMSLVSGLTGCLDRVENWPTLSGLHTHTHAKFCFCLLFETFPRKLFRVLDSCRAHRARSDCVAFNIPFCSVSFQVFPATSNSNLLPLPLPVKILWKMRMRAASFQLKKVRDQHRIASPRSATPLSNQLFCTYVYANFCANK